MPSLAHVNIRTADLQASVAFYRDVLGLRPGPAATRPQSSNHVWMSDEQGQPCIHLQRATAAGKESSEQAGMHHLALACSGLDGWRRKLDSIGVPYEESEFPAAAIVQINLRDPDGVRLELLFADS